MYEDSNPDAADIYARFAQRINSWFNSVTNAGLLYETDLQLRPDGNSGLLVSSLAAFYDYQLNKAWVWEHQALTRARFVAGDANIAAAFEAIRLSVLAQPRDIEKLKHEVVQMREKMRAAHPVKADLFDIKHSVGGIIDVEFLVQFLLLAHAKKHMQLADNIGNIALLASLAQFNIIDKNLAKQVANAYRAYRTLIHAAKLQEQPTLVQLAAILKHQQAVTDCCNKIFN